jgi:hypothetical protein
VFLGDAVAQSRILRDEKRVVPRPNRFQIK